MAASRFRVGRYGKEYKKLRAAFDSGSPQLDDYLKRLASQDQEKGMAAPWLALPVNSAGEDEMVIAGYYTVNSYSVALERLSENSC